MAVAKKQVECDDCQMSVICSPLEIDGISINLVDKILERREPVAKGEYLFRSGDALENLFTLCSGSLKLCTGQNADEERVVGIQLPGELIGANAVHSGFYPYSALALEDITVCVIPYPALRKIATNVPPMANSIIKLMSQEMLLQQQLLMWLTGRSNAAEKLAAFLWGLSKRYADRGFPEYEFTLRMNRGDIGSYLGLASETVSRLLARFQKQNLVSASGSRIRILDADKLRELAGIEQPV